MSFKHVSVLKQETVDALNIKHNGTYVDATMGLGGHSELILSKLTTGKLISIDQDLNAYQYCKDKFKNNKNITIVNAKFSTIAKILEDLNIEKIDGILFDIGTSYYQLTDSSRGFTFKDDTKLDMRMNQQSDKDAIYVLNNYSVEELAKVLRDFGDEPKAYKIAQEIVNYRQSKVIETSNDLNEIIRTHKAFDKEKNTLKNIYQAIRIEVNNEIYEIEKAIKDTLPFLNKGGKMCVITFHSLEDRTVKNLFWELKNQKIDTEREIIQLWKTSKTIYPSKTEIEENNASRTAKLRVITKNHE